jgi:DNA-binding NtrC family response regulator
MMQSTVQDTRGRQRVLIADDDAASRRHLAAILSRNFSTSQCASPESALALMKEKAFHVICSGFSAQRMDGADFLLKVAALPAAPGVVMIAEGDALARDQRRDTRFAGIVLKPYVPARVIQFVHHLARLTAMKWSVSHLASRVRIAPRAQR